MEESGIQQGLTDANLFKHWNLSLLCDPAPFLLQGSSAAWFFIHKKT